MSGRRYSRDGESYILMEGSKYVGYMEKELDAKLWVVAPDMLEVIKDLIDGKDCYCRAPHLSRINIGSTVTYQKCAPCRSEALIHKIEGK